MQRKVQAVQRLSVRPGEGHAVDFIVESAHGETLTGSMDLSTIPVPERRFTCDATGLSLSGEGARLLFAQRQPIGDKLLSMLVINMSGESITHFLKAVPQSFTRPTGPAAHLRPGALATFSDNAPQTVVLTSSIILAGYTGSSACADFYYASPFSIQSMAALKKISLEAVVRVNLTTAVLFALIEGLRNGATDFQWEPDNAKHARL